MEVKFVKAQKHDIPQILDFIKKLAEYEKFDGEVIINEDIINREFFSDSSNVEVIFAEVNSKKVGFALYFHTFSTFIGKRGVYIEDLYIEPEFRKQGIGTKLLSHIAKIAVEKCYGRIELACLDWNTKSIAFYESIGMKAMNEWTVFRLDGDRINKLAEKCT
jgi:GNAT superfamily N-acetyltransferase